MRMVSALVLVLTLALAMACAGGGDGAGGSDQPPATPTPDEGDAVLPAAYSHRVALLQRGRIVAQGPVCEVLRAGLLSEVFECRLRVIDDGEGAVVVLPQRL